MSNEEDPLDEVFQKAEEKTERQKKLKKQKREIKEKLMDMVAELQEEEIDGTQADDIRELRRGQRALIGGPPGTQLRR